MKLTIDDHTMGFHGGITQTGEIAFLHHGQTFKLILSPADLETIKRNRYTRTRAK